MIRSHHQQRRRMISLRNQPAIESWEQLTRDMVRLTKARVRFSFGRSCLLLSDFRSRTANEFYIPPRPKGFTRRDYLRSGRVWSLHRRVNHEKEREREREKREPNRDANNTSIPEGFLTNKKKIKPQKDIRKNV